MLLDAAGGQRGHLALVTLRGDRWRFVLDRIAPSGKSCITKGGKVDARVKRPAEEAQCRARVLHVEDDVLFARALSRLLRKRGVDNDHAESFAEAVRKLQATTYDMVLLDLKLSDGEVEEKIPELRDLAAAPIVVLSGVGDDALRAQVLRSGASDFIIKEPDNLDQPSKGEDLLVERVVAHARRAVDDQHRRPSRVDTPGLYVDTELEIVLVDGARLRERETQTEFAVLRCLAEHAEEVVLRTDLMQKVWGRQVSVEALKVQVSRLRSKLGAAADHIETAPGGWRLRKVPASSAPDQLQKK